MSFQQRLVWTFVAILVLNMIGWWASAVFKIDVSSGPDPGLVVSACVGLITAVVGGAEAIAARRKMKSTDDEQDASK